MPQSKAVHLVATQCFHCGDECPAEHPKKEEKHFCCQGCMVVFDLLSENGMEEYYHYEDKPGISKNKISAKSYEFLDEPNVINKLLEFQEGNTAKISFNLPQIHCSSCIWLLENIQKLNDGIIHSRVNFLQKKASITFKTNKISLRELVQLLSMIGYDPELNFEKLQGNHLMSPDRSLYYKIGLAGFSFGNIMLLSFPEYLGFVEEDFSRYIGYLNILLSLPVLLYSGFDYLRSAFWTIKLRKITIDIPIAIGILALFGRSTFDILTGAGEGYLDSLAGFIFFMLIGKWFQNYTFQSISFDRNYKSYFPISALVKQNNDWKTVSLDIIRPGDIIMIKNEEIIPADSIITNGEAHLDYSFVTGESDLIRKNIGEKIFAGAKHIGSTIQVNALKKVDQSYLTSLWDENSFISENKMNSQKIITLLGKYFTIVTMGIAVLTLFYWLWADPAIAFNSFTAVLIVACPCALSLATPFTFGNILRLLGKKNCYLKNVDVIENMQNVNHIVFDKTGTITDHSKMEILWHGPELNDEEKLLVKSAAFQSNHPLSKAIFSGIEGPYLEKTDYFEEKVGQGINVKAKGKSLKIGSENFVFNLKNANPKKGVFILLDDHFLGYFSVQNHLRDGVIPLFNLLSKNMDISILSGDNDREKERLVQLFPFVKNIYFNQSPQDKLNKIKELQNQGKMVMMVGDGLNDAGALKQSNVGFVISSDSNNFTPACDGILNAAGFSHLQEIFGVVRKSRTLIMGAFTLALIYNIIGLGFAVQGLLSPIVAAILMPVSSVTVMIYGLLGSNFVARHLLKK
ncbi:MAG: heavy metal translocating P-type ATPase metal-binding domain-containing protein [Saprospiraceae bacterium]|nr:heavy metal translocating P-type ATPase metal-binding domain-containing protein [Saprospiraceae bacterium]